MFKSAARSARDICQHNLYLPSHARACLRNQSLHDSRLRHDAPDPHLKGAMEWLRRAHLAADEEGVAARYTFKDGWLSPYPETTGYIIPTFLEYARVMREWDYQEMAVKLADWLMIHQLDGGGFPGGHLDEGRGPVVFNTGQILIGLLAVFRSKGERAYFDACIRTGQWLVENADADGAWRRHTYKDRLHAYHTRVAWPLVDLGLLADEKTFVDAGRANLDFTCTLQSDSGWFRENTLDEEANPFTHTLAYVARGLLEAGILLAEDRYIRSAEKLALVLLNDFEGRGYLGGQYDENFIPDAVFTCLTGNAQIAIVWWKLAEQGVEESERLVHAARRITRQVMHCQDLDANNPGIRGGVPGSWPLKGSYIRYGFPNWAAKFLADALLREKAFDAGINPAG